MERFFFPPSSASFHWMGISFAWRDECHAEEPNDGSSRGGGGYVAGSSGNSFSTYYDVITGWNMAAIYFIPAFAKSHKHQQQSEKKIIAIPWGSLCHTSPYSCGIFRVVCGNAVRLTFALAESAPKVKLCMKMFWYYMRMSNDSRADVNDNENKSIYSRKRCWLKMFLRC